MSTALFNLNRINIFATVKESGMKVMYIMHGYNDQS